MDYTLSPLAEEDLSDIWQYIAEDNECAADGTIRKIFEALELLTKAPLMGRAREELLPNIRSFGMSPYVIFYCPSPAAIEVIRVLHGARDIDGIFHETR